MISAMRIVFAVCDIIMFILYGIDKSRARRGAWRISERVLLTGAAVGGIGAYLGMLAFRHKTRKLVFRILLPVFAVLQVVLLIRLQVGV